MYHRDTSLTKHNLYQSFLQSTTPQQWEQHIQKTANDGFVDFYLTDWSASFSYLQLLNILFAKQAVNKQNNQPIKKSIFAVPDHEFNHDPFYIDGITANNTGAQ